MAKVDPRDFLLNTDYEMDKIVYIADGVIQIDSDAITLGDGSKREIKEIDHGLPFQPLVFGICSYEKDFTNAKSIPYSEGIWFPGGGTPVSLSSKVAFAISIEGKMLSLGYTVAPSITDPKPLYYRIYAFEPTTSNAVVGKTNNKAKIFTLNTDRNYRKIFKKGVVHGDEPLVIKHNLGYIPQMMLWGQYVWPYGDQETYIFQVDGNDCVEMTKDTITISFPSAWWDLLHYRIYYDEA